MSVTKHREWEAYVSIAVSGPARSTFDEIRRNKPPGLMYPKKGATLEYATNDIIFLAGHFQREHARDSANKAHFQGYELEYASVAARLEEAGEWLQSASRHDGFDGGSLVFSFSGHADTQGRLSLANETWLSASDLVENCLAIRRRAPGPGRLRISILVDACHAGRFLLDAIDLILRMHAEDLVLDYGLGASMPDEVAWEIPALRHGLATFCFSVQEVGLGSMTATSDTLDVTWSIAQGAPGASVVSGAVQNPLTYDTGELTVCGRPVPMYDPNGDVRRLEDVERDLCRIRDRLAAALEPYRRWQPTPQ